MTYDEAKAEYEAARAERAARLEQIKAGLKSRKMTGAEIARAVGCSASNVSVILRGNWPHRGCADMPRYFERYIQSLGMATN